MVADGYAVNLKLFRVVIPPSRQDCEYENDVEGTMDVTLETPDTETSACELVHAHPEHAG